MAKKNNPGCNCCTPTCAIFADDFDRSNTSSMGGSWDERAGDWSVSSNAAVCSIANGLMVTTTTNPDGDATGYVAAVVNCNTSNDIARLIIGYVDDNNYYFAQVRFTNTDSYIQLGRKNAGVETLYGFEASLPEGARNVDTLVLLCYSKGRLFGQIFDGSVSSAIYASVDQTATVTGTKAGIATSTQAGVIAFRSFDWQHHLSEDRLTCPLCAPACLICEDGTWPYAVQVEFDGFTSTAPFNPCADFADFNDTVFISAAYTPSTSPNNAGSGCGYFSNISICGATSIRTFVCNPTLFFNRWGTIIYNSAVGDKIFNTGPACAAINYTEDCSVGYTHVTGAQSCIITPIFA